jgi:flagellar biogenesis protein FliO
MTPAPVETKKIEIEYEKINKGNKVLLTPVTTSVPLNFNYDEPTATCTPSNTTDIGSNPPGILKRLLDMVTSLIVVCILAYGVLKLLYSKSGTIIPQITRKKISVIEQVNLQSQKTLMLSLVKVGEKILLLGITEKEINLLREFNQEELTGKLENDETINEQFNTEQKSVSHTGPMAFLLNIFGFLGLSRYFGFEQNISRKKNTGGKNNEEF